MGEKDSKASRGGAGEEREKGELGSFKVRISEQRNFWIVKKVCKGHQEPRLQIRRSVFSSTSDHLILKSPQSITDMHE